MKNVKFKKENKSDLVIFSKFDLQKTMSIMLKEQKEPMSSIFRHIAYLSSTKYFDNSQINIINPRSIKPSVDINVNVMRQLMAHYQSPTTNKNQFIKDFVEGLWKEKINNPNQRKF
jgi:hypothetical protein